MDIHIRINCDNAAFEDECCGDEIVRILDGVARAVESCDAETLKRLDGRKLHDINGNTVGSVEVSE